MFAPSALCRSCAWSLRGCRWGWAPLRARSDEGRRKPLKQWTLIVSPFGSLRVRVPCGVSVRAQDPLTHPHADRLFVTVSGVERGTHHGLDLDNIEVRYDEVARQVLIVSESIDSRSSVDVTAPLKFDLDIKTSGTGCVKIHTIECDSCKIETEKGNSILQSVKSHNIHVRAKGGKVVCLGTIHGNVDIQALEQSIVDVDKLQGNCIKVSTEDGRLKTKYLYAESSFLSSAAGDITLGNVHDSSAGCLKAYTHQGAIDVCISQVEKVDLKSQEGCITVKVPASLKTFLQLSGTKVDVSPEIQLQAIKNAFKDGHTTVSAHMNQMNENGKWIEADTKAGTVSLQAQSWFQSLKLRTL
ncbi:protein FAM185A isoform X2 [Rhinatrema bivittatum]|uniref:protein FAM185A isoform X2 n=1 Tax=Rhinatrema bivittatum TaxID=194408 RepID=UPI00112BD9AA|nr:protein FAM185A isoform X2 [Rhinatrema bivittatum]